jgi:hypothetical protein
MANYGFKRISFRKALPVQVLTGFYPTEPVKLSYLAAPEPGVTILSGMAMKKVNGTDHKGQPVKVFRPTEAGDAAAAPHSQFYIALHDDDSHDVQQSGKLVGLDCSDSFELLTAHFTAPGGGSFDVDDPLTVGANGRFRLAEEGEVVVGYITAKGGNADGSHAWQGATPPVDVDDVTSFKSYIQMKTARHAMITVVTPAPEDP